MKLCGQEDAKYPFQLSSDDNAVAGECGLDLRFLLRLFGGRGSPEGSARQSPVTHSHPLNLRKDSGIYCSKGDHYLILIPEWLELWSFQLDHFSYRNKATVISGSFDIIAALHVHTIPHIFRHRLFEVTVSHYLIR